MKATAIHIRKTEYIVDNNRENAIILDQRKENGGLNQGPTPYELLGMALAGCVAVTFQSITENSHIHLDRLIVDVELTAAEGAKTFSEGTVNVRIKTSQPDDRLNRILEKTVHICPVGAIYEQAGVKLTSNLVIE